MKITILGARGSIPINGSETLEFGGATSCVLVETEEEAVFLDAGTGIINTPEIFDKNISLLITHAHLDHIIGLPFFPYNGEDNRKIAVFGKTRACGTIRQQLDNLIKPPYWPCMLSDFDADYEFNEIDKSFRIGDLSIDVIESKHPDGSLIYKVSDGNKSIVYATDYEYCEEDCKELIDFAANTDLLMIDGQYTENEVITRKGYGHSTIRSGIRIMQEAHAHSLRFVHHDPRHTDDMLRKMEDEVKSDSIAFAREGEVIVL